MGEVSLDMTDLARPAVEHEARAKRALEDRAKEAPVRARAAEKRARIFVKSMADVGKTSIRHLKAHAKDQEDARKARVIAEALRLIKRYDLKPAQKPNPRLTLGENEVILRETLSLLALKRGRGKVAGLLVAFTQLVEAACASTSPIGALRRFHAEGPPSLTQVVTEGDEFEDIVTDVCADYGFFFAELGPIQRYLMAIMGALAITYGSAETGVPLGKPADQERKTEAMNAPIDGGIQTKFASL